LLEIPGIHYLTGYFEVLAFALSALSSFFELPTKGKDPSLVLVFKLFLAGERGRKNGGCFYYCYP